MQKLTTEQEKLGLKQYVQVFLKAYRKEYKVEKKKFDEKTIKFKIRREWKKLEYEQKLEKTGEYFSLEKELLNYQSQISDHFRWE